MGFVVLLGQSVGSGQPWSKSPSAQKSSLELKGPHNTKSTSNPFPIALPSSSNSVFWTIWISIEPESPIWITFHEGLVVEYKHAICPKRR